MPRFVEKDTLSRDVSHRIRKFAFHNMKQFYTRYLSQAMSYYAFLRVINNHEVNCELVEAVENCAKELHVISSDVRVYDDETTEGIVLRVRSLLDHIDKTLATELSFVNLSKLKEKADELRPIVS